MPFTSYYWLLQRVTSLSTNMVTTNVYFDWLQLATGIRSTHMVRNHQDGYPYINLALFFFFLKKSRDFNLFGKIEWSMNSEPRRAGDN